MGCACVKPSGADIKDRYKIGSILGSGSFGQVRNCTDKISGEVFAVKVMSKERPRDSHGSNNVDFASMFRNEVALLSTLSHSHVIKLHRFYEDKYFLYAVMDKCEGGELFAQVVKKKRFPENEASRLTRQMLLAINYVHDCGIVHRDIKAENFLFAESTPSSSLILIDFGMSTKVPEGDKPLKQLCGSPHYVAPELIKRQYRYKVDMWALGVVVYLMLFGKYPFEGPDQKAIVQAIVSSKPEFRRVSCIPSDLSIAFINALLEKDPENRLSSRQALEHPWIEYYHRQDTVIDKTMSSTLSEKHVHDSNLNK